MILSINGLYEYNKELFDEFLIPSDVDKDSLIYKLCTECAEFELIYPDYYLMKSLIGHWSKARLDIWKKIDKALSVEFNPLDDFREVETRITSGNNANNSDSKIINENVSNAIDTEKVASYESSDLEQREQNENNTTSNSNQSSITDNTGSYSENGNVVKSGYRRNAAKILKEALEIYNSANIYDIIISEFKREFCILIY